MRVVTLMTFLLPSRLPLFYLFSFFFPFLFFSFFLVVVVHVVEIVLFGVGVQGVVVPFQ